MNKSERLSLLNKQYKPLISKAKKLLAEISPTHPKAKLSFYNGHYTSAGKNYVLEHFPIPVIDINDKATIVIDFDGANFECYYNKQFIEQLTLSSFKFLTERDFASYPYDNCLIDLYKKGMLLEEYKTVVQNCNYSSYSINFKLTKNYKEDILFIINQLL